MKNKLRVWIVDLSNDFAKISGIFLASKTLVPSVLVIELMLVMCRFYNLKLRTRSNDCLLETVSHRILAIN